MAPGFWSRGMASSLAGLVLAWSWGASATLAQEPASAPSIDDLLKRIEKLEKQNELLRQDLNAPGQVSTGAGPARLDQESSEDPIGSYLQKQTEAKKKAESAPEFQEVGSDLSIKASWKDGVVFETPLKDFRFHVGGRMHYDTGWFSQDEDTMPNFRDAAGFRRARLRADGSCYEVIRWVVEFDFANPDGTASTAVFTDVFAEVTQLPIVGNFRIGHFKVPYSLEELTSSNYMNTLERSLGHSAFAPQRHLGMGIYNTFADDRMFVGAGWFRSGRSGNLNFDSGDGEYCYAARITCLPIWLDEGRCLLHLGGAYAHLGYNVSDGPAPSYATRSSIRLGTPILLQATGGELATLTCDDRWGAELAGNLGSLSFQSEVYVLQGDNQQENAANPHYWATYVQASYFLTGEHRPYNKKLAVWDRVRPHENFFCVRGCEDEPRCHYGLGAWEVVARYAYLDLKNASFVNPTAADKSGGTGILQDLTFGINWYWNPNFRCMLNYVHTWRDSDTNNRSGTVDGVGLRVAYDF